jgi:hypothetical protein
MCAAAQPNIASGPVPRDGFTSDAYENLTRARLHELGFSDILGETGERPDESTRAPDLTRRSRQPCRPSAPLIGRRAHGRHDACIYADAWWHHLPSECVANDVVTSCHALPRAAVRCRAQSQTVSTIWISWSIWASPRRICSTLTVSRATRGCTKLSSLCESFGVRPAWWLLGVVVL